MWPGSSSTAVVNGAAGMIIAALVEVAALFALVICFLISNLTATKLL